MIPPDKYEEWVKIARTYGHKMLRRVYLHKYERVVLLEDMEQVAMQWCHKYADKNTTLAKRTIFLALLRCLSDAKRDRERFRAGYADTELIRYRKEVRENRYNKDHKQIEVKDTLEFILKTVHLDKQEKDIIQLYYFENQKDIEIAQKYNITRARIQELRTNAIKRLSHGVKRLNIANPLWR